ncbi:MAG: hypothetical protein LBR13_06000 [Dysgonamonadaceae bacterium]|jgi:tetratricopeptide (TPR) repeat protein|nr:hypothetical protein [Dysgonamonadaceae bacterium]
MKKTILLFAFTLVAFNGFTQRTLKYLDRFRENEVCRGADNEACVFISVSKNIGHLDFYSYNKSVLPNSVDTLGGDVNYRLVFDASEGKENRQLDVYSNDFSRLAIEMRLAPKKCYNYYLYDPDSTIVDCYNQLTREALNLFQKGIYDESKAKYISAKSCSNVPDDNDINARIALIDSIVIWKNLGDAMFDIANYTEAVMEYLKIYTSNPNDKYIADRLIQARTIHTRNCITNFSTAEMYFLDNDYAHAETMYNKVILQSCETATLAIQRLQEIHIKQQLPHVLTYEYAKNAPIGISSGNYKNHAAAYFTLRLNPQLFEAMRNGQKEDDKPELNVSFGWTLKTIKPVWLFFGPGYTAVGKNIYEETDIEKEDPKLEINHAVSPEAGILCKLNLSRKIGIALRYTFQYRFALKKEQEDYIGKNKHIFGIGVCFF